MKRRFVHTTCSYDCGGRCLLKVHLDNESVARITSDSGKRLNFNACIRGILQHRVLTSPDRLTQPLLRTGRRGSGQFKPIEWDRALDLIAASLKKTYKKAGPESILSVAYSGAMGLLHNTMAIPHQFFDKLGGCVQTWGSTSLEGARFASKTTLGDVYTGNSNDCFEYSKCIILWGWNPLITRFGGDAFYFLKRARKKGCKIISVDPRLNETAKQLAQRWIPIKPGTDTAMLLAMANVIITEKLQATSFIERFTFGYENFKNDVLGKNDGVGKTPQWASDITGVSPEDIHSLAVEYATRKPSALVAGWAPGRTLYGEQYHRAAITLSAITGNIGKIGGFTSGGEGGINAGLIEDANAANGLNGHRIHIAETYRALLEGKQGGFPGDIKILYIVGCNLLNQLCHVNKGIQALQIPELVVCHELFMTPTAKFADLVLPVCHFLEKEDIGTPWMGGPYVIYMHKAADPLPEARSDLAIFRDLASRLGIEDYFPESEYDWLKNRVDNSHALPTIDELKRKDVHPMGAQKEIVAFKQQIDDPQHHAFSTPSGKIEIFSQKIETLKNPSIPPIPQYIEAREAPGAEKGKKYSLQFISTHARTRVNSTLDNIPELKKRADDRLWINVKDAEHRGIKSRDSVRVFNQNGSLKTTAKVTDDIMVGVVSMDAGAWYKAGKDGIDVGGCVNSLTADIISPAGAFACNSCRVEVVRDKPLERLLESCSDGDVS